VLLYYNLYCIGEQAEIEVIQYYCLDCEQILDEEEVNNHEMGRFCDHCGADNNVLIDSVESWEQAKFARECLEKLNRWEEYSAELEAKRGASQTRRLTQEDYTRWALKAINAHFAMEDALK
jgi:hypothetical protein